VNTWDTGEDLPEIPPVMADTVIGTIEITKTLIAKTLIAIARRAGYMRGTVTASEGTIETGEIAGAHPQPVGVGEDTRLTTGAEEAIQGARREEEALVATGNQMVHVVPASPQQVVWTHVGEVDKTAGVNTVASSTS